MTPQSGIGPVVSVSRDLVEDRLRSALDRGLRSQVISRRSGDKPVPLSYAQWRMWFQEQLAPGQPTYNLPIHLRLQGYLDVKVLEASLIDIVRRHEILRTTLHPANGAAMQMVHGVPVQLIKSVDLQALPADRARQECARVLDREARRPFDLAAGPLFRVTLIRLDESNDLLLSFHHAIMDGWSTGILFQELETLYAAGVGAAPAPLKELPLQYADYAIWQRERFESGALDADSAFWKQRLADLSPLELPTDHPRPAIQSYRGRHYRFTLPDSLRSSLSQLAQQEETTLYVLLLSAFVILLARYTGQEDIAVGSPLANRKYAELEGLIGLFVNTLVMRNDLSGDPTFRDLLKRTREMTLAAFSHQDFPLEKLMEDLAPERDLSRSPLYQVMFGLQNVPASQFVLPGLRISNVPADTATAKFEWLLLMEEEPQGLEGVLEYNFDLFDAATVERAMVHFEVLLQSIVADPGCRLSQLHLLADSENRQLLIEGIPHATGYPRDSSIDALFAERARHSSAGVAIETADGSITYLELEQRANQLSRFLTGLGVTRESAVGVCLERSAELVVVLLAILKAGAAYVPLDPTHPGERLKTIVGDAGIKVLLSRRTLGVRLTDLQAQTIWLDEEIPAIAGYPSSAVPRAGNGQDLAYVIYTSGSTGTPKGVAVPHRAIVRLVMETDYVDIIPGDVIAQVSTPTFDAATFEIWGALLHGARLAMIARDHVLSPPDFAAELRARQITVMFLTTALFNQMTRDEPGAFRGLRTLLFGGEMADPACVRAVLGAGPPQRLLHVYGPTENTTFSTWYLVHELAPDAKNVPIGRAIANDYAVVLDRWMNPTPWGIPGELFLGGDGLARGYLNRPDLTAASLVPDPMSSAPGSRLYRTGDRVRLLPNGNMEFLGRFDNQIKLRGFRIELSEVEHVLSRHPQVRDCVVLAKHGSDGQTRLVAYVAGESRPDAEGLRAFAAAKLPGYMVPAAFIALDELPLNANGKFDRRTLEKLDETAAAIDKPIVPPRNRVEEILVEIWSQELNVPQVGIEDDFFQLGGHSLLATKLIARVRQAFGTDIPLRRLFEAPKVAEFSTFLIARDRRGENTSSAFPAVVPNPAEWHRPFPLTDIQEAYWAGRTAVFELGNVGTHIYIEMACATLDVDLLEVAWQQVIGHHQMLRAVILEDGVQQILSETPPYRIEVADCANAPTSEANTELQSIRERLSHQVFDPAKWPLFELRATRLPGGRTHLHFSLDALICDAWSLQIIFSDLLTFYRSPLAPLPVVDFSFRDYVQAELALRESGPYQTALQYWRGRLDSIPPAPDLPLAVNLRELRQPRFVRTSSTLAAAEWSRIKDRAIRSGLTPSVVLLTAFADVLATWSKTPRFTLNLTLFNRLPLHPQVDQIVGDFTSLNLLEADWSDANSFVFRGRRLQNQLWEDLDHRYVSGVRVLRELARRRGSAVTMPVVFTSMLSFTDAGQDAGALMEQLGELTHCITQTPQVWLDHQVAESNGALEFNWDTLEGLFPSGMLDDMFAAYCARLHDLATAPDAWTAHDYCLLPPAQLTHRKAVNATSAPISRQTLHGLFQVSANAQPGRTAILSSRRELTYAELARESRRVASLLIQQGAKPNTLIAIVMEKGWEQVVAALGILQSGAAYLPIDPSYPAERVAYLLRHGQARVALTQSWLKRKIDWPDNIEPLAIDALAADDTSHIEIISDPNSLAYVIYTSGSTGMPKGVMIDHRGAVNTILDINQRFDVGPQDHVLALSSLSFDLSVYDIFGTLAAGGTIVFPDNSASVRDPSHWLDLLERYGVTIWNSVPALMELAADQAEVQRPSCESTLRLVMMSGDWIPLSLPERVHKLFPTAETVSLGGATEASIWSVLYPIGEIAPGWKSIPYGKPMLNQTFHVLNHALAPCPVWVPGELYIGGIGVALGYWHDEERTRASFIVHPGTGERLYRTGDLGRYLSDGNIEFLGREDFQVKVHGYRVELGEIEAALGQHAGVQTAIVVAKGKSQERRLEAYYVPRQHEAPPSEPELRAFLERALPRYMVPSSFVMLADLPLSANGKVDRGALPDRAEQQPPPAAGACDPRIVQAAESILKIENIDPRVDLLSLGATSVDVIRILNQIHRIFGFRPDMRAFYDDPSIAALTRLVDVQHAALQSERRLEPDFPPKELGLLFDPDDREAFKLRRLGLRPSSPHLSSVSLPQVEIGDEGIAQFLARRSHRHFAKESISQRSFSAWLRWLGPIWTDGAEKYLYPSAGGLYAVQTYIHLKPSAVEGLTAGAYYYHPIDHALVCLTPNAQIDARIHEPHLNRAAFEEASFSLFLVARMGAVTPLYGEFSPRFAQLEAGHMGQVLMSFAPASQIALCPIGDVDFEPLRAMFDLDQDHALSYVFIGGALDVSTRPAPVHITTKDDVNVNRNREEWEL